MNLVFLHAGKTKQNRTEHERVASATGDCLTESPVPLAINPGNVFENKLQL